MSKSEYKRLAVQIPDVVKVIREQVLDETIAVVLEEPEYISNSQSTRQGYVRAVNDMKRALEALKTK